MPLGGELLQILSQQDQVVDNAEDAEEPVAAAAAHMVGEADGAPTDGKDEELQGALAAETEHKVVSWSCGKQSPGQNPTPAKGLLTVTAHACVTQQIVTAQHSSTRACNTAAPRTIPERMVYCKAS